MGATQYDMIVPEDRYYSIAQWFSVHYPHKTQDKELIRTARKRSLNGKTFEQDNKIYLIP